MTKVGGGSSSAATPARIVGAARTSDSLGVCFDTCHAFAAGYDLASAEGYEKTFAEMTSAEKDFLSHRGKAMRKLCSYLKKL